MHMRGWDKVNKEAIHMLSKAVSTLKLRMARVTFDRQVQRIKSIERSTIIQRQRKQFHARFDGMKRKKDKTKKKDLERDLNGIKVEDSELEKEAQKLGMCKQPNYVILGDITLSASEIKYLEVHYKVRERKKVRRFDMEVEISKLANKHRYVKMGQGDNIEKMD